MALDKDRTDPHPSPARPRASKNQPGLRPSPQPNDSVPTRADHHVDVLADPATPKRDPHKELAEAEADYVKIKNDVMAADHAIRAAKARVEGLRAETGVR